MNVVMFSFRRFEPFVNLFVPFWLCLRFDAVGESSGLLIVCQSAMCYWLILRKDKVWFFLLAC